jgi:hypothetical protein
MLPHLFEQNNQINALTPPASPSFLIPCALPNLEYLQLIDSTTLAHSSKKQGGVPRFVPFQNEFINFPRSKANRLLSPSPFLIGLVTSQVEVFVFRRCGVERRCVT